MNLLKHDNIHTDLQGKRRIRNLEDEYAKLWQMYGDLEAERDRYKKALTILDTWEFSGRMGKREMKNIVSEALQEARDE